MATSSTSLAKGLVDRYFDLYPDEAVRVLEELSIPEIVDILTKKKGTRASKILEKLRPEIASECLFGIHVELGSEILGSLTPERAALLLARRNETVRTEYLERLDEDLAKEIKHLLTFPPDSAARLMDPDFVCFRPEMTAKHLHAQRGSIRKKRIQYLLIVDGEGKLAGFIPIQDAFLADPSQPLARLIRGDPPSIRAISPREEVLEVLEKHRITALPVVDFEGHLIGVIRQNEIVQAVQDGALAGIQTMVGVSKDERALSTPLFSVRKRLPWLNINLLTAFLAAAVVGLFESTIAQFTALAVLLPVVAGQSGNTGAQALAVTMRGLALREVRPRHWPRLLFKEGLTGFLNGVAIAIVTGFAVLLWSQSTGLCLVIGVAMVLSMVIAGVSGASIPIILTTLGQDPAQSSSIILTTVTDVMGFLSFLGLATIFASAL